MDPTKYTRLSDEGILELDLATFAPQVLDAQGPVLVECYSPDCRTCHRLSPLVAEAALEWEGRLKVVRLDTLANRPAVRHLALDGLPTLILFRDGREVDRLVGFLDAARLRDWIESALDPGFRRGDV
jgi:thioredoxin-like negative regulator of GroEL